MQALKCFDTGVLTCVAFGQCIAFWTVTYVNWWHIRCKYIASALHFERNVNLETGFWLDAHHRHLPSKSPFLEIVQRFVYQWFRFLVLSVSESTSFVFKHRCLSPFIISSYSRPASPFSSFLLSSLSSYDFQRVSCSFFLSIFYLNLSFKTRFARRNASS